MELFPGPLPDLSWNDIITRLIEANELTEFEAAVKILVTSGRRSAEGNSVIVTVEKYEHRLANKARKGFSLAVYPFPRQSPLSMHKTLNYLYYHLTSKWADQQGADESIILDPDHSVSETNTGNLIFIKDKTVILPASKNYLPGVMLNAAIDFLTEQGYSVEERKIKETDLNSFDEIIITNSLIGAVPAISVGSQKIKKSPRIYKKINKVFGFDWFS